MNRITSLRVSRETRNRLAELGSKDETFDEIIQRLIEFYHSNCEIRQRQRRRRGGLNEHQV